MATREHLRRLLNLFSFKKIAERFEPEESTKAAAVHAVVDEFHESDIWDFTFDYHPTTKHHVKLYSFQRTDPGNLPGNPLGMDGLVRQSTRPDSRHWFYVLPCSHRMILRDPFEEQVLTFPWPVSVTVMPKSMMVRTTILEKSLSSHIPGREIVRTTRELSEGALYQALLNGLNIPEVRPMDLNKGVKELWEAGQIDSGKAQWKKARATTTQVMDSNYLLRQNDPELYQSITDKPLLKMSFDWLDDEAMSIKHFAVDATFGELSFSTYSDLERGPQDVVRTILERN